MPWQGPPRRIVKFCDVLLTALLYPSARGQNTAITSPFHPQHLCSGLGSRTGTWQQGRTLILGAVPSWSLVREVRHDTHFTHLPPAPYHLPDGHDAVDMCLATLHLLYGISSHLAGDERICKIYLFIHHYLLSVINFDSAKTMQFTKTSLASSHQLFACHIEINNNINLFLCVIGLE